ncbi:MULTISPECIES: hypothetical protein [Nitrosomonas]|uniref:Uncharacterized protein n=1 Tax=Nitrosomonas eutropha TaxID=916 RepID=A0ABX5M634_9PROT|nr:MULTISPECIES: hypothetical protein [Nitrosomonas]MXS79559.1 hypothetical protein [Nitrosomonas sp. GH22]PXV80173.1 hypothetical protein C8R14_11837 [Nitrosomonas eutropha]SDW19809.1 hypothetical protein SAMN05216317_10317 [Nitrosomonas eutropha]
MPEMLSDPIADCKVNQLAFSQNFAQAKHARHNIEITALPKAVHRHLQNRKLLTTELRDNTRPEGWNQI